MTCKNCIHCFSDTSVGVLECENSEITENELEKYFTNAEKGYPYFKKSDREER